MKLWPHITNPAATVNWNFGVQIQCTMKQNPFTLSLSKNLPLHGLPPPKRIVYCLWSCHHGFLFSVICYKFVICGYLDYAEQDCTEYDVIFSGQCNWSFHKQCKGKNWSQTDLICTQCFWLLCFRSSSTCFTLLKCLLWKFWTFISSSTSGMNLIRIINTLV